MATKKAARKKASSKKARSKKAPAKKKATKKKATKKKATRAKAAKKSAAKKSAASKAPAKKVKKKARKPIKRRDATGHLDQSYANDLRRLGRENADNDDNRGFLVGKNASDAQAQELGREFVETVTSGEDEGNEVRDQFVSEEIGGPFVTTTSGQEVAEDEDESNPKGSTREPFPTT